MATEVLQPQTLWTTLNYHLEPERGGAKDWCPGTVGDKRRPHEHKDVTVTNIRGYEADFSLDRQGFEVGPFATSATNSDFDDNATIQGQYYQDVAAHVKKATGATKVVPVVHIARRLQWEEVAKAEKDLGEMAPVTGPTSNRSVHIDQSYYGAELVRDNKLKDDPDLEKLKKTRWAIINLWRPFDVVNRDNLACCDAQSAEEKDLVALYANLSPELRNAKTGYNFAAGAKSEAWEVKANPGHKWYYAANIRPDEALLIKQFDSKPHGVARRTPHSAFTAKEDFGPTRQSIEVRCLVFWEDQPQE